MVSGQHDDLKLGNGRQRRVHKRRLCLVCIDIIYGLAPHQQLGWLDSACGRR